jgi:hypothetical protein
MKMKTQLFTDADKNNWDDFVWQSNNGTLFHTRRFLSYHPPQKFEDASLEFFKEDRLLALFPATIRLENEKKILSSHRGASYGGFVTQSPLSIRDAFRLVESLVEEAQARGFRGIDLTPPPAVYLTRPNNYIDFALFKNGFTYQKREISSVVPLDFSVDEILNVFSPASRRAVRRAKKLGVKVIECNEYDRFYQLLKKNLKMRHHVTPTHTVEELLLLKDLFPERIKLFGAYAENILVAGVVLFECNNNVVLAFYISHDEEFQHFRGVNLLFHEIIKWSLQQGFRFLDFGIFTVNMEPNWGLGHFKESFGAQGIFRDTLSIRFD